MMIFPRTSFLPLVEGQIMNTATTMRIGLSLLALAFAAGIGNAVAFSRLDSKAGPKLAHMVFFTLKDSSAAGREKFIASCEKYLTDHEGVEFFAIGTQTDDVVEPGVGIKDFDVSLHVIFGSKELEAKYLAHPRHLEFVEKNKADFAKVRVFDSYVVKK
jgi:hypothetical protein